MSLPRKGPFRLVTVNTAPERAQKLIGQMINTLSSHYDIDYVANCSSKLQCWYYYESLRVKAIQQVAMTVQQYQPDVLFSASMWSPQEANEIKDLAESIRPSVTTHALPHGLQVEGGPDAVVEYLIEVVPRLLDGIEI